MKTAYLKPAGFILGGGVNAEREERTGKETKERMMERQRRGGKQTSDAKQCDTVALMEESQTCLVPFETTRCQSARCQAACIVAERSVRERKELSVER